MSGDHLPCVAPRFQQSEHCRVRLAISRDCRGRERPHAEHDEERPYHPYPPGNKVETADNHGGADPRQEQSQPSGERAWLSESRRRRDAQEHLIDGLNRQRDGARQKDGE